MRDNEAHSSGATSSPVAPAAGRGEEIPGKQKHHRVPPVRRPRCVHSLSRRSQCAKCAKGPNLPKQGVRPKKRMVGLARIHKIWRSRHGSPPNSECATSPRSGIWRLGQIHSTSTFAFRPFVAPSIAQGCFTWSVPRLLGATPRWKSVLSQLFRTFVQFHVEVRAGTSLFLLASPRPLDDEAVIRVGTLSLVQFVGLTVIAVRLLEELPIRGSREPTEQM